MKKKNKFLKKKSFNKNITFLKFISFFFFFNKNIINTLKILKINSNLSYLEKKKNVSYQFALNLVNTRTLLNLNIFYFLYLIYNSYCSFLFFFLNK